MCYPKRRTTTGSLPVSSCIRVLPVISHHTCLRVVLALAAIIFSSSARMLLFLQPCWSSCITLFRTPVGFYSSVFLVLVFLNFLVWLVLFRCRTRYVSISLALPWLIAVVLFFLRLSLWPHNLYLSRMKNQHGHWVYWCRWVERTV